MDYAWNAAGKLEAITAGDAKLEYSYNRTTGTLSRIAGPGGAVVAFAWDGGLPISTEWLGPVQGKVSWRYDNYFRPVARQVNDQEEISYVYDADGLLTGSGAYTIFRDEQTGRPSTFELPGVTGGWIYAPGGELKDSAVSVLGSEIYSSHYERDEAGRITRKEENTGGTTTTWEYAYDAGGRLDTARVNGNLYANYRWDDNDNRTAEILPASTIGASFDPADRLIRRGNTSYSYKPSGELSERDDAGVRTRLNIDPWGNLLSFASPDHNVTFIADPQGRRVAHAINGVVERAWVYEEGNRPAAELDADGNIISEFVYAGVSGPPVYMIRDGQIHLFVVDQLGSIRMLVNTETGEVAQQIDYDPFGKILQNTNPGFQPFGFAGGLHDPVTDLVRFGVRDYDPTVGRFISPDPRTFTGGSNHYVYCGGDPINLVDPLGTDPTSRASQLVNTGPAKQISQATQQAQQVVDVAKDASQLAGDPKSFLESKASKAVPEGAKSEYEKTLEENAKTAEESSSSFLKELEELYQKARKQLCGDDEEDQKKRQEEARKKQEQRAKDAASKKEVKSSSTSDPSRGPQPIPRPKTVVVKPPSLFR
jgi:RHS repeat-associated protein